VGRLTKELNMTGCFYSLPASSDFGLYFVVAPAVASTSPLPRPQNEHLAVRFQNSPPPHLGYCHQAHRRAAPCR
jgi:hypothetical protein